MNCIFCKLIAKEIPSLTIEESDKTISFFDITPKIPYHALIVSKTHKSHFDELTLEERNDLFTAVNSTIEKLKTKVKFTDYKIQINNGESAGQEISHIHVHLMPNTKIELSNYLENITEMTKDLLI